MGNTLNIPSPTKLARLGHFPPASQADRLAGPAVFYVYVFLCLPPPPYDGAPPPCLKLGGGAPPLAAARPLAATGPVGQSRN
jgi:hypothetical protein